MTGRRFLSRAAAVVALALLAPMLCGGDLTAPRPAPQSSAIEAPGYLGLVPSDEAVAFTLDLRLPGEAALDRFLADVQDPASPAFRDYLTADTFGERFGLPSTELSALERRLAADGVEVTESLPQRTLIRVRASAATVGRIFRTRLGQYVDGTGRRVHRPLDPVTIPAELRWDVTRVIGLDDSGVHVPRTPPLLDVPAGYLGPADIRKAFELGHVQDATNFGAGETIAIIGWDTFLPADVAAFDAETGINGPAVEKVPIGTPVAKPGDGAVEVNLDIDTVRMIAPQAQILEFETGDGALTNGDMVAEVVKDGRAKIATISWGNCLSVAEQYRADIMEHDETQLKSAAGMGINVFYAAGDSGPYGCRHGDRSLIQTDPDATGSSPNVIDVGGTELFLRQDGSYLEEVPWEWPLTGEAGGGGRSKTFPRPDWQVGPGVLNKDSNGMRQTPDVSGPADCFAGFHMHYTDPATGEATSDSPGCGTSAASPFWAAIGVLIQAYARGQGIDHLGYLNRTLYAVAAQAPSNTLFHDVIRGANLGFDAAPGWDWATGLGSPRVDPLADAIVAYLKGS